MNSYLHYEQRPGNHTDPPPPLQLPYSPNSRTVSPSRALFRSSGWRTNRRLRGTNAVQGGSVGAEQEEPLRTAGQVWSTATAGMPCPTPGPCSIQHIICFLDRNIREVFLKFFCHNKNDTCETRRSSSPHLTSPIWTAPCDTDGPVPLIKVIKGRLSVNFKGRWCMS